MPVDPQPHGRVAYCFDNSVRQAEMHGGEAAYGWAIWRWPGRWFEAEHHAVWRRPDGSLLDVTPQLGDPRRILFLPDPQKVFDPERYRRNVMAPEAGNPLAAEYIDLVRQRADITDTYWYPGVEVLPLFSEEDRARLAPIDARMAELRREMARPAPANSSQLFADMVRQPGHALNPAWQALSGEISTGKKARPDDVRYVLRLIRRRYPELEGLFEEETVRRWEARLRRPLWIAGGLGFVLTIAAAVSIYVAASRTREMAQQLPKSSTPGLEAPSGSLTNQRVDIDRALEMLFGDRLSIADIEDRNPQLSQLLHKTWNEAYDRGDDPRTFVIAVSGVVDGYYRLALRTAPDPSLIEYFRINLDGAQALREHSGAACVGFLSGGDYDRSLLPPEIPSRTQQLAAKVLLDPTRVELKPASMSPALQQAAAARASLALPVFNQALAGRGSLDAQCAATIALWETLLALPPAEGAALLRQL
ncbi:MAG: hypothetical protein KF730_05995 [Sphingomonas sp.]|uniref:hypothetical protein n=1 Tax=Sphingomonas sp. TaxID=28214 RepID=UPI0025D6A109|nr:hypothetical protein [Sphingomonas sp.]MBX3564114.1 hypothetical protein [Sphingomonas sp.]